MSEQPLSPTAAALEALRAQLRRTAAGFDPRLLPLEPAPWPHTALDEKRLQPDFLRQYFAQAGAAPSPEIQERPWREQALSASAVLLALVLREQGLQVLLTQRAAGLRNHSGQIAFAGGRVDAQDADAIACALREAREEIGLPAENVEVLGTLAPYTTGTAFEITPVVALVRPDFAVQINPAEVDSVFEIDLAHLLDPRQHFTQQAQADGVIRHWWAIPSTDAQGQPRFVWGASAGILRNFYQFLRGQ